MKLTTTAKKNNISASRLRLFLSHLKNSTTLSDDNCVDLAFALNVFDEKGHITHAKIECVKLNECDFFIFEIGFKRGGIRSFMLPCQMVRDTTGEQSSLELKKVGEKIKCNSVLFVGKAPTQEQTSTFKKAGFLILHLIDYDNLNIKQSVFGFNIGVICVNAKLFELSQQEQTLLEYAKTLNVPITYQIEI